MSIKSATAILLSFFAIGALAQTPAPSDTQNLLDQIAGCIDGGNLNVDVHLRPGRVSASPQWAIEVIGTPTATLVADAAAGRVRSLDVTVKNGSLFIIGKGLRPTVSIDDLHFEEGGGITAAHFRGRGIWRPIVAVFRPLARFALRSIDLRTDIPAVMRGNIIGPATTQAARASGSTFLDLVQEVDIGASQFAASRGRPLSFGDAFELRTASMPKDGKLLRASIDRGVIQPAAIGRTAQFDIAGTLDGEIEDGAIAFIGDRCTFSHGNLRQGAFRVASAQQGKIDATLSAAALDLDLTSGQFRWPGGPRIGVEAPSHLTIRELHVQPDGGYSGVVDAALSGKVGALERDGSVISASDVNLRTRGARIVNGKASGNVQLEFNYRLDYTLVVRYPVKEIGDRHVQLLFEGLFDTQLLSTTPAPAAKERSPAGTLSTSHGLRFNKRRSKYCVRSGARM